MNKEFEEACKSWEEACKSKEEACKEWDEARKKARKKDWYEALIEEGDKS